MSTKKINPLDLNPNVKIGIKLPLGGSIGFESTYTTDEQVKHNLKNLLLTNKHERIMQPKFYGVNSREKLFSNYSPILVDEWNESIKNQIEMWMPYIGIADLDIKFQEENKSYYINLQYYLGDPTDIKTISFVVDKESVTNIS